MIISATKHQIGLLYFIFDLHFQQNVYLLKEKL